MKQSTIKEITGTNEWNKWQHWPVYYISMNLENWESITLWKKKPDAFKVGDEVFYETVEEWKRWKEVKPEFKPKAYTDNNKWAMIGMALKIAFECYYDKKEENFQETIALANRIVEEAMNMLGTDDETAKNDSLPF